jgi:oxygen-independent coproporphyrinogen-3 oxidase
LSEDIDKTAQLNPESRIPNPASRRIPNPVFRALPPLSLYIHIPFCARKCPYCDFNSHEARGALPEERYVRRARRRSRAGAAARVGTARRERFLRRRHAQPVLGGQVSTRSWRRYARRLPLAADAEVSLEANPGTFEANRFREFRAAGSESPVHWRAELQSRHLKALGRIHDDAQARRAIEFARREFDNVNLDLMYGLPGQTWGRRGLTSTRRWRSMYRICPAIT